MGLGHFNYQTATMASAGTTTSQLDLGGRTWASVYLRVPTMNSNSAIILYGSHDNVTYSLVKHPPVNSITNVNNDYTIASASTNVWVPIPNAFRYIKVVSTATVDNGVVFTVICADNG